MARILTTPISGSQCIGDSLIIINNNYEALDTVVYALSTNTLAVSSTATTTPTLLTSTTSYPWTKQIAVDINDNSITSAKLTSGSVGTLQLSSDAVTTAKIASGVTITGNLSGTATIAGSASNVVASSPLAAATCKAWVNFDGGGTNGTNQTIRSSYNVSSVYKNSTGNYTITFLTSMADTNYLIMGQPMDVAGQDNNVGGIIYLSDALTKTTAVAQIKVVATTGTPTLFDSPAVHVLFFGN